MEMESTRRSFDRSREQAAGGGALKKPRLTEDQTNPNGRPFRPATATSLPPSSAARFRVINDRDSEVGGGGGAYHPQPQQYHELVSQYKTALAELTFNSKPIITNLTIIAGENLHAAKAIATTVCANILEVPSDQKLPSLYLLDSIVKNIGRDYIKYFAARLPEVFCKAYRQVDPPVHSSMRHLFGTWKGVFPPQSLQMIEKELGFASALNGSSSSAATSRLDSQSRRSIHINPKILEIQHLQQSSRAKGMATDLTVPIPNTAEDVERPERAASIAAGRSWVDPPVKMHNIQHTQREILSDPGHEKKIGSTYGDFEYNSEISRISGLGIGRTSGRVAAEGHEKPWYGAGNSATETISGQKNGFTVKHGFPNYSTSKPVNVDLHLQRTQSNASKSTTAVSASWKNSEEEEFMWDMHSRLSDHDAANLSITSRKDRWTPDGSEKLEFENQFRKPQNALEVMSRFERETSSDLQSTEQREQISLGHRLSSPWRLKESHPTDGLLIPGSSGSNTGQTDGYSATLGGLSASSSLARMPVRPHTGNSGSGFSANTKSGSHGTLAQQRFQSPGAALPSGQSPVHQNPLSPSFPALYPNQQFQSSAEQDLPLSQSLPRPDYKTHQLSGNLLPSKVQPGSLKRLQNEDSPTSAPPLPSIQLNRQYPFSQPRQAESKHVEPSGQIKKPHLIPVSNIGTSSTSESSAPDMSTPLSAQTSGQSSTSSLLAAVMSSGILSSITNGGLPSKSFQDVGKTPSQSSIQPPLPSGPPPQYKSSGARISSASAPLSDNDTSVTSNISEKKEEQPPLPPGPPPSSIQSSNSVNKAANPISNLLSSLVAKGLISASKSETSSPLPPESPTPSQSQNPTITNSSSKPASSVPASSATSLSSTKDEASFPKPDVKSSAAVPQPTAPEIESLIGLEFKSDVIRESHPHVIGALFDDFPHQCSICGLQLKLKERLDRHLEWHIWSKPEPDGLNRVRRWYADLGNWVAGKAEIPFGIESSVSMDEFGRTVDEDEPMVLADENQCVCVLCGELFEDYYSQQRKKWMFKAAMHLTLSLKGGDIGTANENSKGPIVHVNCMSESSVHDLELTSGTKMVRHSLEKG
ncbi:polyadenylation and cleavage factor homolog 4 isoform X1 [Ricinus communis]|uniref:polyadenylation and cleavage factor homolog 4 isoform X1 n=2 Tax=Ricinus communis TaxID=3988 RepID=UPI00201B0F3E|nr:polyadenylation and cleavage factor homolog 4 isoform X1 [Ricinus communis]